VQFDAVAKEAIPLFGRHSPLLCSSRLSASLIHYTVVALLHDTHDIIYAETAGIAFADWKHLHFPTKAVHPLKELAILIILPCFAAVDP
jgi:hypothetical protein